MFNQINHRLKHTDVRLNATENDKPLSFDKLFDILIGAEADFSTCSLIPAASMISGTVSPRPFVYCCVRQIGTSKVESPESKILEFSISFPFYA